MSPSDEPDVTRPALKGQNNSAEGAALVTRRSAITEPCKGETVSRAAVRPYASLLLLRRITGFKGRC